MIEGSAVEAAVEVLDVWCTTGKGGALQGLNFTVHPGEVVALVSPSGSASAWATEVLLGRHAPQRGSVRLLGRDPAMAGRLLFYEVGALRDPPGLHADLTVRENLRFWAGLYRMEYPPRTLARHAAKFGLGGKDDVRASRLSPAEWRLLALARVLLTGSQLLILENPLRDLDRSVAARVRGLLEEFAAEGKAALLTCCPEDLPGGEGFRTVVCAGQGGENRPTREFRPGGEDRSGRDDRRARSVPSQRLRIRRWQGMDSTERKRALWIARWEMVSLLRRPLSAFDRGAAATREAALLVSPVSRRAARLGMALGRLPGSLLELCLPRSPRPAHRETRQWG